MRSMIASAVLGLSALGASVALPAKADASWLSQALRANFDAGYYPPAYSYYGPAYGVYPAPSYGYATPYVVPYQSYGYGSRYYSAQPWYGSRSYGGWQGGRHESRGHSEGHGHHQR